MTTKAVVKKNTYRDSVSLMSISTKVNQLDGVRQAFVAMGTEMNKEVLRSLDLLGDELGAAGTGDLMIIIVADGDAAVESATARVEELLDRKAETGSTTAARTYRTVAAAAAEIPGANLAVISVNGAFAAHEARKALDAGLHVMLFSDNVSVEDEIGLKRLAHDKGLLLMGPDCGTAIIGNVGLCFANAVRPGRIGIVGASGTGTQEISVRIHRFGGGLSQVIGTGGRDLSEAVGGLMMLDALDALDADPGTDVVVLISKPPAASVERRVLDRVATATKPVVVCFLNGSQAAAVEAGAVFAATTDEAARQAVRLAGLPVPDEEDDEDSGLVARVRAGLGTEQRYIRGLFCGGTLCDEAMHVAMGSFDEVFSNIHADPAHRLPAGAPSKAHTFLDFGDDAFTNGRPHPMIDPANRIARIVEEARDPEVGVIALDFVLGFGAHEDPAGVTLPAIAEAQKIAADGGRHLEIVAYVLGTDLDAPSLPEQVGKLRDAGVTVARSSAELGRLARDFVAKDALR